MNPDTGWISVGEFVNPEEARLVRVLLESAGIPAMLSNDHTFANRWAAEVMGKVAVLVPPDEAEAARKMLETKVTDEELRAQAEGKRDEKT